MDCPTAKHTTNHCRLHRSSDFTSLSKSEPHPLNVQVVVAGDDDDDGRVSTHRTIRFGDDDDVVTD